MKPPAYWFNPPARPGLRARLLSPFGLLRARAAALWRGRVTGWHAPVPVISVGNLDADGTGKTLTVMAIVGHLEAMGLVPVILSRGHDGSLSGPLAVDPGRHGAADVGEGPLLEAAFAPTWIARDLVAGARSLLAWAKNENRRIDCIVMDGGYHSPALAKDISIAVVDAARGFGNGRPIPAGPLCEPLGTGLKRVDILLSIGEDSAQHAFDRLWGVHVNVPRMRAGLAPLQTGMEWQGARVLALAGIRHPESFFASLRNLGADLLGCEVLEDHNVPSMVLLTRLEREALRLGAQLVTTEKDAVRLPPGFRSKVVTLPMRLRIGDWHPLDMALARVGLI